MATTNVFLTELVDNLGGEGDEVCVRAGYARNYLLPRKLALPINRVNRKYVEALRTRKLAREQQELEHAQGILDRLKTLHVAIPVKTGEGGRMFGSVSAHELIKRLAEDGVSLEKKQLNLYTPVKALGKHTTKVKLHPEITFEFEWEVVSENPIDVPAEQTEESTKTASQD